MGVLKIIEGMPMMGDTLTLKTGRKVKVLAVTLAAAKIRSFRSDYEARKFLRNQRATFGPEWDKRYYEVLATDGKRYTAPDFI